MYIKHTQDFMDSKGYQHVDTIKIDDIFLKKGLMKKWDLSKMDLWVAQRMHSQKFNSKLLTFA